MVIEHLGENAQHCCFILIDGTLNVDIEQNRLCLISGCIINQHEGGRIICKLLAEALYGFHAVHFLVLQQIRKHLQEVRFTTSKEAGNPHTHIRGRCRERISVVIKK